MVMKDGLRTSVGLRITQSCSHRQHMLSGLQYGLRVIIVGRKEKLLGGTGNCFGGGGICPSAPPFLNRGRTGTISEPEL